MPHEIYIGITSEEMDSIERLLQVVEFRDPRVYIDDLLRKIFTTGLAAVTSYEINAK